MWDIMVGFLEAMEEILVSDLLIALADVIGNLFMSAFYIESLPGLDTTVLNTTVINEALDVLYGIMLTLLALKLLWKGFSVYILWRDGDADNSPGEMLLSAVYAMIVAVMFPLLYDICVDMVMEISQAVLFTIAGNFGQDTNLLLYVANAILNGNILTGFVMVILIIIYIIVLVVLIFKLLGQAVELLIYRLGVPIAVVGLVNSDGGAWKPYIQMLFKQAGTILVQYFCIVMGIYVVSTLTFTSFIVGIAFEVTALAAPRLLAQFTAPSGGGPDLMQKAHTFAMVMRSLRG